MGGYKDHRNALKPQNMTYEDRVDNLKKNSQDRTGNGLVSSKIFPEGDMTLSNNLDMMQHGYNIEKKLGRPLMYASLEIFNNEIFEYVKYCTEHQLVPTRPGLALWLGTTSGTLRDWKNNPANPFAESIKKAEELFHEFILQKTVTGSINTLLYFFLSKNWFDMSDKTEIVHRSSTSGIDLDEQQRIISSTPGIVIDAQIIDSKPCLEDLGTNTTPEDFDSQNAKKEPSEDSEDSEDFESILSGEDFAAEDFQKTFAEDFEDFDDL